MEKILEDLINKQKLILDYLVNNYEINKKFDSETSEQYFEINSTWDGTRVYGQDIESDVIDFYPFGKDIIKIIINLWTSNVGLYRYNNTHWNRAWITPKNIYNSTFSNGHYEDRRYITINWSPEMLNDLANLHNIDAEVELTTMIVNELMTQIDDNVSHDLLSRCRNNYELVQVLNHLGYEIIQRVNPMNLHRTISIVETTEGYNRRRISEANNSRLDTLMREERQRLQEEQEFIRREDRLNYEMRRLNEEQDNNRNRPNLPYW